MIGTGSKTDVLFLITIEVVSWTEDSAFRTGMGTVTFVIVDADTSLKGGVTGSVGPSEEVQVLNYVSIVVPGGICFRFQVC